jgi:hypothetical protein
MMNDGRSHQCCYHDPYHQQHQQQHQQHQQQHQQQQQQQQQAYQDPGCQCHASNLYYQQYATPQQTLNNGQNWSNSSSSSIGQSQQSHQSQQQSYNNSNWNWNWKTTSEQTTSAENNTDLTSWSPSGDGTSSETSPAGLPIWSNSPTNEANYCDYYNTGYPTPPTPAGSTISNSSNSGELTDLQYPGSVAPSIPSDHYPPTPYSVDLSSPQSQSSQYHQPNPNIMGYVEAIEDDIPLHELIGAAEAVEADLLESLSASESTTCTTLSSINSSSQAAQNGLRNCRNGRNSLTAEFSQAEENSSGESAVTAAISPPNFTAATLAAPPRRKVVVATATKKRKYCYSPVELQKSLSDACLDLFNQDYTKPGYPLAKLLKSSFIQKPVSKTTTSLKTGLQEPVSKKIRLVFDDNLAKKKRKSGVFDDNLANKRIRRRIQRSPSPPALVSCNYKKSSTSSDSDQNSDDSDSDSDLCSDPNLVVMRTAAARNTTRKLCEMPALQKQIITAATTCNNSTTTTAKTGISLGLGYTFTCSGCCQSWPLEQTELISKHLSSFGLANPVNRPTRQIFSQFFANFSYKVRLLVNPIQSSVTCNTVISCNFCSSHDWDLSNANEDLAVDLQEHLVSRHPEQQKARQNSNSETGSYCLFCDRRVNDLKRHMEQYFSIHHSRLTALATCHHFTNKRKNCGVFDDNLANKRIRRRIHRHHSTNNLASENQQQNSEFETESQIGMYFGNFGNLGNFGKFLCALLHLFNKYLYQNAS